MNGFRYSGLSLACALAFTSSLSIVQAKESTNNENDNSSGKDKKPALMSPVVVSSEHIGLSTLIQENKGMVNVVKREEIEAIRPRKLEDFNSIIPGFASVGFLSGGNRSLFIRGIGAMHDVNGSSVAVTVDGIPQDSLELQNPYIADNIESIEFFKTSQQVLYGKSGQAGSVNIKTRRPTKSAGTLMFGIGNDGYKRAAASYDYVPSEKFRLSGFFDFSKEDGWVNNSYQNKKYLGYNYKNYNVNASLKLTPRTELSLSLFGAHTHDDGPLKAAIDPITYRPINGAPIVMKPGKSHEIPFWDIYQDTVPTWDRDVKGGVLKFTHKFDNDVEFSSVTSYKKYKHHFITDLDATVQYDGYMSTLEQTYDYRYLTQSFQFKSESHDKWKWVLGTSGYQNKFIIDPGTYHARYVADMSNWQKHKGYGVFGQVMWSPVPEFDFLLGMRYQVDKTHAKMIHGTDSNVHTDKTFLYSFTPTWNITDTQHIYATVAKNYGPSIIFGFGNLAPLNKESGMNYEVGYVGKWLGERLSTAAILFMNDIKNRQVENPVTRLYDNFGRERSKGFELSVDYQINDNFTIGGTYTKISPKLIEYKNFPQYVNNTSPFTPLSQGNVHLLTKHETSIGDILSRLDVTYTGKSFGDRENATENKPYTLVNLSVALKKKNHEFTLWGKNLLNKEYYNMTFKYGIFPGKNATYGRGRSFGLDYKYRF